MQSQNYIMAVFCLWSKILTTIAYISAVVLRQFNLSLCTPSVLKLRHVMSVSFRAKMVQYNGHICSHRSTNWTTGLQISVKRASHLANQLQNSLEHVLSPPRSWRKMIGIWLGGLLLSEEGLSRKMWQLESSKNTSSVVVQLSLLLNLSSVRYRWQRDSFHSSLLPLISLDWKTLSS